MSVETRASKHSNLHGLKGFLKPWLVGYPTRGGNLLDYRDKSEASTSRQAMLFNLRVVYCSIPIWILWELIIEKGIL